VYELLKRGLFLLSPERAHVLGMAALRAWGAVCPPPAARAGTPDLSVTSAGLRFAHPVVLAAGFDKDAEAVAGFFAAGFAGVEVGTVTPRPQPGNPSPRLFRIPEARALINRMLDRQRLDRISQAAHKSVLSRGKFPRGRSGMTRKFVMFAAALAASAFVAQGAQAQERQPLDQRIKAAEVGVGAASTAVFQRSMTPRRIACSSLAALMGVLLVVRPHVLSCGNGGHGSDHDSSALDAANGAAEQVERSEDHVLVADGDR